MKSSTTITEKLSNEQYFELLRGFYETMSDAIIKNSGEVYQYIGDEVVISWKYEKGIKNGNCLQCFFDIKKALNGKKEYFLKTYNQYPDFKGGLALW